MAEIEKTPRRKLRLGLVGGGAGSNIGETHRQAARLDRRYDLVTGVFAVEHASSWASILLEAEGHKQALWRTTPAIAGKSTVIGDLGTHAHHLARYITGLEVSELSAESCAPTFQNTREFK